MLNLSAVDENKDIATKEYVDGKAAVPTNHASSATTYGVGTASNYGHVKLSASTSSTSGESNGVAATPSAVKAAYDLANGKANASHTHSTQQLYYPNSLQGMNDVVLRTMVDTTRANRLAFLPADQIIIEQTTDGGTTWTDAGITDANKVGLFSQTRPTINLPRVGGTTRSNLCGLRITITAMKYTVPSGTAETAKYSYWKAANVTSQERYANLDGMYFWIGANGDQISVKVERATGANPDTWVSAFNDTSFGMTGWSGNDFIKFGAQTFGGGTTQTGNYWNWRITLMTKYANGTSAYSNSVQSIYEIRGYGTTWWGGTNNLMKNDHLYTWDYQLNATFPAQITATQFNGALNGTATNASKVNNHTVNSDVPANAVFTDSGGTITKVQANGTDVASSGTANIPAASTSAYGVTKLYNGTDSTSTALAATANAVKTAYDLANGKAAATHQHAAGDITSGTLGVARGGTGVSTLGAGVVYHSASGTGALSIATAANIVSAIGNTAVAKATDASTVSGYTVAKNVPSDAVFTDTNTKVTQTVDTTTSGTSAYPVLLKNTTGTSTVTDTSRFDAAIKAIPATGNLQATLFNGYTLAAACAKGVDTSMTSTSTSTNLPTTKAVVDYVNSQSSVTGADYITAQGTSNGWVYRKWNSGISECWGNFSHSSVSISSKSGNAWYSGEIYETFPSGLFNASPVYCDVSANPNAGVSFEVASGLSSTRTQAIYLMRLEGSATVSVWLQIHAIGTWK